MKTKLVIDNKGDGLIAIGIYANKEDATKYYNRAFNYGITSGSLMSNSETFHYFLTDKKRLEHGLKEQVASDVSAKYGDKFKGKQNGLRDLIALEVQNKLEQFKPEQFYSAVLQSPTADYYSGGKVSAERPDISADCKD